MSTRVKRREFIMLIGGAAASSVAWSLPLRAQQAAGKVWRIGLMVGGSRAAVSDFAVGFPQRMRELGYVEGKDFVIEWRFADGNYERFSEFAADFVRLKVDVFLVTSAALRTVQQATTTIPIVMVYSTDPVGNGLVASLARPGGNITGLAGSSDDTAPKQLELLASVVPKLSRIGVLRNPGNPSYAPVFKNLQAAAESAGLVAVPVDARNPAEIETAFAALAKERVGALIAASDAFFLDERQRIAELALEHRLPSMFAQREHAEAGGLMSYGESLKEFYRRAAVFVDKIIKGAKPGDLPVEQPTTFHLVINRKTADALGLTLPPQLLIFADEVIE
jgi:putative tryptophan/tyrosine transport system substrate-binding protein